MLAWNDVPEVMLRSCLAGRRAGWGFPPGAAPDNKTGQVVGLPC